MRAVTWVLCVDVPQRPPALQCNVSARMSVHVCACVCTIMCVRVCVAQAMEVLHAPLRGSFLRALLNIKQSAVTSGGCSGGPSL